jgi:GNAT superfamily N-acetyltransferase
MNIVQTEELSQEQKLVLFELWNSEYPEKVCYKVLSEFEKYLEGLLDQKHYLLLDSNFQIQGWGFTFLRDRESWFGIIIKSDFQGLGFGSTLLDELKNDACELNGWVTDRESDFKLNIEPYVSPLPFYIKNGFFVKKNSRIENEKISAVKITWRRV